MTHIKVRSGGQTYTRISKTAAAKLWSTGQSIYVIAAKMRPGFPFSMGMMVYPSEDTTFGGMVSEFAYYNCAHETGYYPAFYAVTDVAKPRPLE